MEENWEDFCISKCPYKEIGCDGLIKSDGYGEPVYPKCTDFDILEEFEEYTSDIIFFDDF